MLAPQQRLQARYRVVRSLGQGGSGTVYEALDERLGVTVALKHLRGVDEDSARRFAREARLLANLRHPALPRVTDHFSEAAGAFLVMEFVPGDDLAARQRRTGGPVPVAEVLAWADALLDALAYLHAQTPPILHRDIKTENVKVTAAGQVMLLDFGLARPADGDLTTVTATNRGYTLAYAPLEQIQGKPLDPRSDLFALAATLTDLLTGRRPPDVLTRVAALAAGQPDPLRPANERNPAVPAAVAAILRQALDLDPSRRPDGAAAFRAALRSATDARPDSVPATARPPAGVATAGAGVLVTLLFTDIEGSTALWDRHRRAMSAALSHHDRLLHETITAHGGAVFKTAGDGVHAAFELPADALAAAVAAQRALRAADWGDIGELRVRMALHTGEAEKRNGDYFGPTANRVARLLTAGHGAQILVSQATHQLVREFLPDGVGLRELGTFTLKGLSEPERIFQLVEPTLPRDFPPLVAPTAVGAAPTPDRAGAPPAAPARRRPAWQPVAVGAGAVALAVGGVLAFLNPPNPGPPATPSASPRAAVVGSPPAGGGGAAASASPPTADASPAVPAAQSPSPAARSSPPASPSPAPSPIAR